MTLDDLKRHRRITVTNPDTGMTFGLSLRGWLHGLYAIRVHPPHKPRNKPNPFTTAHRLIDKTELENLLSRLI